MLGLHNTDNSRPFVKKFRWTFEAKAADGTVTYPQSFVKITQRPNFPYSMVADENGGHKEYHEDEFIITQFFTFFERAGEAKEKFDEFVSKLNLQTLSSAVLRMYDGCGEVIEEWQLSDVVIFQQPESRYISDPDDIIVDWLVSYKKCEWINLCPTPLFTENPRPTPSKAI